MKTAQAFAPAPRIAARTGFVDDIRRFATDLVYPIVADRRLSEQILFYRQMATLVSAGIPLIQALRLREERAPNGRLKTILVETLRHLESGGSLSAAFARHPETFSPLQVAVLHAGEAGGVLDESLSRIADYLEAEQRLRRFINRQMTYTKILFVIAQFVIPAFFGFVSGASVLNVIWGALLPLLCLIVGVCLAFGAARTLMARFTEAAGVYEQVMWALPGIGRISRSFALCRFGRAVGTLYAAGVPLQQALRFSGSASGSRLVTRAAEEMAGYAARGVSLGEACRATAFFPERTADMMTTGAESGSVDTMMLKMADYLAAEAETQARQFGFFACQAFYLFIALTVSGLLQRGGGALIGAFVR